MKTMCDCCEDKEYGAVIWLTGVPASGKSTLSGLVEQKLVEMRLPVENLDADEVRANLSPNLGYTEEARDENTKRLAWMAQMLSRYGCNVLVAAVSPLRKYRDRAREWCPHFIEVMVETPLEECKRRDPKGLYARADRGEISDIAGWHMPFEAPQNPEVFIDTMQLNPEDAAEAILAKVRELGYI
jgi:adenylyl-sulfate kinase